MYLRKHILTILALSLMSAGAPIRGNAGEPEHGMEQMIESAKSRADHEALAGQYEAEANDLLAQAERHERMGKRYRGLELGGGKGPKFAKHCAALAENFRKAAGESQELAALHRELAGTMGK